ncbi:MAG: hypothetical protein LBI18_00230, partial [Planctomycetaceae bacterium]|nr:hypothetical protein [Planctomycetaceae bacterium]
RKYFAERFSPTFVSAVMFCRNITSAIADATMGESPSTKGHPPKIACGGFSFNENSTELPKIS